MERVDDGVAVFGVVEEANGEGRADGEMTLAESGDGGSVDDGPT